MANVQADIVNPRPKPVTNRNNPIISLELLLLSSNNRHYNSNAIYHKYRNRPQYNVERKWQKHLEIGPKMSKMS